MGLSPMLELGVGVMLVALGADVLRRLVRERVHFHRHRHGNSVHVHAHSHKGEYRVHDAERHAHVHVARLPLRPLFVGMTHGLAGSAALVVLAASSTHTPLRGFAYVLLFGAGSIVGMAALSAAIALPLSRLARLMTWTRNAVHAIVGTTTLAIGATIIVASASAFA
jgi:ABC-type nickel/cobalt efflux system permease component RcnA